jgi:hypothetical protein
MDSGGIYRGLVMGIVTEVVKEEEDPKATSQDL